MKVTMTLSPAGGETSIVVGGQDVTNLLRGVKVEATALGVPKVTLEVVHGSLVELEAIVDREHLIVEEQS